MSIFAPFMSINGLFIGNFALKRNEFGSNSHENAASQGDRSENDTATSPVFAAFTKTELPEVSVLPADQDALDVFCN